MKEFDQEELEELWIQTANRPWTETPYWDDKLIKKYKIWYEEMHERYSIFRDNTDYRDSMCLTEEE